MRLLDLFCGAGGCTKGYQRAGFSVVGVDIRPQPHYCGDEFIQMDALAFVDRRFSVYDFDAIHASPPCQSYSKTRAILQGKGLTPKYEPLIEETRALLRWTGLPYCRSCDHTHLVGTACWFRETSGASGIPPPAPESEK